MNSEQLEEKNPILEEAWERFALYDKNASRRKSYFKWEQIWILSLGVLVTLLTLLKSHLLEVDVIEESLFIDQLLQYFIILLPITISVLTAAANRFRGGNKWILLRAAAEAIKREIFRYRVFKKSFPIPDKPELAWEEKLADKLNRVNEKLIKTEVNMMALHPVEEEDREKLNEDYRNKFELLGADDYVERRIKEQLSSFYETRTEELGKKLKCLYWLIYIIGGLGTLLAAVGFQLWVAFTTTLVAVITTYLQYEQVENTLMIYNQAATNLSNIKTWWIALPNGKKKDIENIKKLVELTETALQNELSGWVQQMEDAISDLYKPHTSE